MSGQYEIRYAYDPDTTLGEGDVLSATTTSTTPPRRSPTAPPR